MFDKAHIYEDEIKQHVDAILKKCKEHNISCVLHFEVAQNERFSETCASVVLNKGAGRATTALASQVHDNPAIRALGCMAMMDQLEGEAMREIKKNMD